MFLNIQDVQKSFENRGNKEQVLQDINLKVEEGEFISLLGPSGCGKSTLLNIVAGFLKPEQGSIEMQGKETTNLSESDYAKFRSENMGFIFQNFQLMPGLTAFENIELPLKIQGMGKNARFKTVEKIIKKVITI